MQVPIACVTRALRLFGRLSGSEPSAWIWAWSWDPLRFARRYPSHHLSPARANYPAGLAPEARLSRPKSPQQRSDQARTPVPYHRMPAVACPMLGTWKVMSCSPSVLRSALHYHLEKWLRNSRLVGFEVSLSPARRDAVKLVANGPVAGASGEKWRRRGTSKTNLGRASAEHFQRPNRTLQC